jgi:hypothetical protein
MRAEIRIAALFVFAAAAATAAQGERFAGTWQATFKNTVFLVLKVKTGEKVSGTLNAGGLTVNDDGDLQEVRPVGDGDHESPIFFAKIEGDKLAFDFQDDDAEVMHFELTLKGEAAGELRLVDKDHPNVKPFTVKKVG